MKSAPSTKIFTNEIGSVVKAFPRTVTNKLEKTICTTTKVKYFIALFDWPRLKTTLLFKVKLTTDDITRAKIEANVTALKLNPLNKEIKIVKATISTKKENNDEKMYLKKTL